MREEVGAQIRDHPLTQDGDEVITNGARGREHRRDGDQRCEILVDELQPLGREAVVDHAPHRERHRKGRCRRDEQGRDRARHLPGVAQYVTFEPEQRREPGPLAGFFRRRGGGPRDRRRVETATLAG